MSSVNKTAMSAAMAWVLAIGASQPPAAKAQSTFDVTIQAGACANCHGTDGRSPGAIPSIAGRPESMLIEQLKAFRSDTPPTSTTIMDRLVKGFSDDEITALAHHFSQIPPQPRPGTESK